MKKFGSVIYYVILYNAIITFVSPKLQNFWMALFLVFAAKSFKKPKKYNTIFQQFYAEDCFLHIFFIKSKHIKKSNFKKYLKLQLWCY